MPSPESCESSASVAPRATTASMESTSVSDAPGDLSGRLKLLACTQNASVAAESLPESPFRGYLRRPADGSSGAGVAEAVICVVLAAGAVALSREPARGRQPALAALAFAILGFIVGLTFTIRGGAAIDLAYHAVMLPVLVVTTASLLRQGSHSATAS